MGDPAQVQHIQCKMPPLLLSKSHIFDKVFSTSTSFPEGFKHIERERQHPFSRAQTEYLVSSPHTSILHQPSGGSSHTISPRQEPPDLTARASLTHLPTGHYRNHSRTGTLTKIPSRPCERQQI
ncbi:hypothetical protein PoB_000425400 [Plakobranchus ocellatus]|uniref:Uncharacterized protein n=1 Tax=Plakobranchus ocellatus TaxID=259542 RepID=A0AAV3Y662_9GAST|nr:hypothetical protein PoB_000425400 [Plakobranchus ocellatus]